MTSERADLTERAALTSGQDSWSTTPYADIPSMVLSDGPHGVRRVVDEKALGIGSSVPATCYPPAVSLAASWDDELIGEVGRALGREAKALGVSVLLGPGINIKRSPLGGRNFEYASEDPLVAGRYGVAFVRGVQSEGVAATPKHFAANNQETDRLRVSSQVDERALREIYLPAFERVVTEAQPWALMTAYNLVNGVYASEDPWLLTTVLREEWGFDGIVMSDWGSVWDRVAALVAGLDLEMPPTRTDNRIVRAVEHGEADDSSLQRVVDGMRRLASRTTSVRADAPGSVDVDAGHALARRAAQQSAVLLRNDGALPLAADARVAVVGELARAPRFQGNGSSRINPTRIDDLLAALTARRGAEMTTFAAGYRLDGRADDALLREAVCAVSAADVAVVAVGLPDHLESEGFDRDDLQIPAVQTALVVSLASTGTPLVVVLSSGGVLDLREIDPRATSLVHGGLLGQAGGSALADLLTGDVNFSAKLTETIAHRLEDSPSFPTFPGRNGIAVYGESVFVGYRGFDARGTAVAYPFGHGLSYTTFAYTALSVHPCGSDGARVEVTVRNTGERAGAEIVQFYVGADDAVTQGRPIRELRDYVRVALEPGEQQTLSVQLPMRAFSLWDARAHRWTAPEGRYRIEVGASSRDIRAVGELRYPGDGQPLVITRSTSLGELRDHPIGRDILAGIAERRGATGPIPEELMGMVNQTPLIKLTAWGDGITEEMVDAWTTE